MIKKPNILSRAISKLKQMEKQLVEESQVLDELKNKEKTDRSELSALRSELAARQDIISSLGEDLKRQASENEKLKAGLQGAIKEKEEFYTKAAEALREELKKLEEENGSLSRELAEKAADFRTILERERADFRLNAEKLEAGAAGNEKELSGRIEELKESLRQKTQEATHKAAEAQALLNRQEALKEDYEGRLLEIGVLNDSLKEDLKKQEIDNLTVSRETRELNETNRHLRHELARSSVDIEKATSEAVAIKTLRDSDLVKLKEQDIFSKSAVSALKEKEEDLDFLKGRVEDLSSELDKTREDHSRRLGILRLELDEKKGIVTHLKREIEINKAKLADLEKDRRKSEERPK